MPAPCADCGCADCGRSRRSQEEASRSLLDVQAQLAQWKELSTSSSEMDQTEANQLKVRLTATVGELQARRTFNAAIPSHRTVATTTASTAATATETATRRRLRARRKTWTRCKGRLTTPRKTPTILASRLKRCSAAVASSVRPGLAPTRSETRWRLRRASSRRARSGWSGRACSRDEAPPRARWRQVSSTYYGPTHCGTTYCGSTYYGSTYYGSSSCEMASGAVVVVVVVVVVVEPQ